MNWVVIERKDGSMDVVRHSSAKKDSVPGCFVGLFEEKAVAICAAACLLLINKGMLEQTEEMKLAVRESVRIEDGLSGLN